MDGPDARKTDSGTVNLGTTYALGSWALQQPILKSLPRLRSSEKLSEELSSEELSEGLSSEELSSI